MWQTLFTYFLAACTIFVAYTHVGLSLVYWRKAVLLLGCRGVIPASYRHIKLTIHQSPLAMFARLPGISTVFFIAALRQIFRQWSGDGVDMWLCLGAALACMAFAHHAMNTLPTTAVLLSASGQQADRLLATIQQSVGILPFHLLGEGRYPDLNSFRTSRGSWETVVQELLRGCPSRWIIV